MQAPFTVVGVNIAASGPHCAIQGTKANAQFGWSVRIAGDVNGDYSADIIIGHPGDENEAGKVVVYYGCETDGTCTSPLITLTE